MSNQKLAAELFKSIIIKSEKRSNLKYLLETLKTKFTNI